MAKSKTRRRTPQRTCVVCRTTTNKRALTRLVRTPDDGVHLDPTGKRNGRGAYVCDNPACWDRLLDSDVLERALRVSLTDDDRDRIAAGRPAPDE